MKRKPYTVQEKEILLQNIVSCVNIIYVVMKRDGPLSRICVTNVRI